MRLAATIASLASDFELCPLILPLLPPTAPLHDEVAQERVEGGEGPLEVIRSFSEAINTLAHGCNSAPRRWAAWRRHDRDGVMVLLVRV